VIGHVDEQGRALIEVPISKTPKGRETLVATWIDTAFDGHLVFPLQLIEQLGLETLAETEAILADGTKETFETYLCYVDWFGEKHPLQVIASDARFPLLGVGLLMNHDLHISYRTGKIEID
jgi:clan AA aspartic protease